MRSIYKLTYLAFLFIVLLLSCNKPVVKYNPDFEGQWRTLLIYDSFFNSNVMSEIVIDGKDGSFMNTCSPCNSDLCNCISTSVGKAVMNSSKTQLKIGSTNSFPLTIDEEPNIDSNGEWTMKIEGLRYYRQ